MQNTGDQELNNQEIFYKLVRFYNYGIHSYISGYYSIEYKIDEWVYPKIGKLFVFDSIENARKFDVRSPLYSCQVKNPIICKKLNSYSIINATRIRRFWNNQEEIYSTRPPMGTYNVDSIKLIERIK